MKCAICEDKRCLRGEECRELSTFNDRRKNIEAYLEDKEDMGIMEASASVPKNIPRLEEVARYIENMSIERVGVAFCKGLHKEGRVIHKFLEDRGIEVYSVVCGNGGIDRGEVGIKKNSDVFEISCNPLGQGSVLNKLKTEINIAVGLCVGHDMLFSKYSEAPVTTLIVKDRINSHNPIEALKNL
ncbi:hypothetical protein PM10SUCC1_21660 [Propionigenium maris DSM 9537]|uniref:Metal-binding protein n=1 Tax=Propionigenium maris DSM 9537 TaxID=1123000 RepID=A0A9W6GN72_9FUSO|nr:DUF1847 domain-containing protein [Propionigenium maris]GLI56652.1 hypothetical protein PM10SUCC1_21660 [Propionigenium maris DSM 9537]